MHHWERSSTLSAMSSQSFNGFSGISTFYSHGHVKVVQSVTTYTWTINNFCICRKKNGEVIDSPIISAGADSEHRWRMLLYPRGRDDEHREHVSIFLFLLSSSVEGTIDVRARFAIVSDKLEEHNERRVEVTKLHRGKGIGCADFIRRDVILDKANGLLHNGHLTILCEIGTGVAPINAAHSNNVIHDLSISETRLADDLEHLLEEEKYSDVVLVARGKQEFRAHKSILCARSPAFARLLEDEGNSKRPLQLDDVEPEVLKEMLRFVYASKVENLAKMAPPLLRVAQKYELEGLKTLCEETLCKSLSIDSVVDTLLMAEENGAEKLRTGAISFVLAHAKDVVETPAYKRIADSEQMHLLAEVFRVIALQRH